MNDGPWCYNTSQTDHLPLHLCRRHKAGDPPPQLRPSWVLVAMKHCQRGGTPARMDVGDLGGGSMCNGLQEELSSWGLEARRTHTGNSVGKVTAETQISADQLIFLPLSLSMCCQQTLNVVIYLFDCKSTVMDHLVLVGVYYISHVCRYKLQYINVIKYVKNIVSVKSNTTPSKSMVKFRTKKREFKIFTKVVSHSFYTGLHSVITFGVSTFLCSWFLSVIFAQIIS